MSWFNRTLILLTALLLIGVFYTFFEFPSRLVGLLLLPLLFALFYHLDKKEKLVSTHLYGEELASRFKTGAPPHRTHWKRSFIFFGLFFAIFSLANPRWGFHWEEVQRRGTDLLIALDISDSMLAEDLSPNRLKRAIRKIQDFLTLLEGDRVGLVIFSGVSFTLCPLTLDYGALAMFLDEVDTDFLPVKGTNISEAIQTGLKSFDDLDRSNKAIILITDGEQNEGEVLKSAEEARKKGVKIFSIGIGNPGKEGGVPIPLKGGGVKKDSGGNIILTQLNEKLLAQIAHETGGGYKLTESGDIDLVQIYQEIRKRVEEKDLVSQRKKVFETRFQWFLVFSLLFLLWGYRFPIHEREGHHGIF